MRSIHDPINPPPRSGALGRFTEAYRHFMRAAELRPDNVALLLSAANMKMKLGAEAPTSGAYEVAAALYRRAAALPGTRAQMAQEKAAAAEAAAEAAVAAARREVEERKAAELAPEQTRLA